MYVRSYACFIHQCKFHSLYYRNRSAKYTVFKVVIYFIEFKSSRNSEGCQKTNLFTMTRCANMLLWHSQPLVCFVEVQVCYRQANHGGQLERMSNTWVHKWDGSSRTSQMTFPTRTLKVTEYILYCLRLNSPAHCQKRRALKMQK